MPAGSFGFMLPEEPEEGFYADPPIQRYAFRHLSHRARFMTCFSDIALDLTYRSS